MIVGAIDVGTNSARLLVAEKNGGWRDILRTVEVTRLGEGVNSTRRIKPGAMERTLKVLEQYKNLLGSYGARRFRAISTSAMRDAENATEFVSLVKNRIGLDVEVISGAEEGRLTFTGATGPGALTGEGETVLVVDIGGGSTEYIYGKDGQILGTTSLDIGSVRLAELFAKHDPPLKEELEAARDMIKRTAEPVFKQIVDENPSKMIAVAGTATQLSAVLYEVEPYDPEKIHGSRITLSQLKHLIEGLSPLPIEERKRVKGMHPKRADVIVFGALILEETVDELCFPETVISERDILDGIVYSLDG